MHLLIQLATINKETECYLLFYVPIGSNFCPTQKNVSNVCLGVMCSVLKVINTSADSAVLVYF